MKKIRDMKYENMGWFNPWRNLSYATADNPVFQIEGLTIGGGYHPTQMASGKNDKIPSL
jgi:hypothetical protein